MFKLIYSINMHTIVYQFEQSVIDHYERISLYTKSIWYSCIMIDHGLFMMIYKPSKLIYSSVHIDRVYHFIRDHFSRARERFGKDTMSVFFFTWCKVPYVGLVLYVLNVCLKVIFTPSIHSKQLLERMPLNVADSVSFEDRAGTCWHYTSTSHD